MAKYGTDVNMEFGTTLRFKKDWVLNPIVTFEKGETVRVANYVHKYYVELHHRQLSDLPKMRVELIDDYLEEVPSISLELLKSEDGNGFNIYHNDSKAGYITDIEGISEKTVIKLEVK